MDVRACPDAMGIRPAVLPDPEPFCLFSLLLAHANRDDANCAQYPPSQVYSFVPIPGAQQHKRPRRRYEEIERMYKCGWNGCEKAYGTLNHLNAHVTMQSHGQKRTPEGTFDFTNFFLFNNLTGLTLPGWLRSIPL